MDVSTAAQWAGGMLAAFVIPWALRRASAGFLWCSEVRATAAARCPYCSAHYGLRAAREAVRRYIACLNPAPWTRRYWTEIFAFVQYANEWDIRCSACREACTYYWPYNAMCVSRYAGVCSRCVEGGRWTAVGSREQDFRRTSDAPAPPRWYCAYCGCRLDDRPGTSGNRPPNVLVKSEG